MEKERMPILVYKHGKMNDKQNKAATKIKDCARELMEALWLAHKAGLVTEQFEVRGHVFTKDIYKEWKDEPDTRERRRARIKKSLTSAINDVDKLKAKLSKMNTEFEHRERYPNEHIG